MVRITQATEHDLPNVRSLYLEYFQWLIPSGEEVWGVQIEVTPVDVADGDIAAVQQFMPPTGRLLLAREETSVIGCACVRTIRPGLA